MSNGCGTALDINKFNYVQVQNCSFSTISVQGAALTDCTYLSVTGTQFIGASTTISGINMSNSLPPYGCTFTGCTVAWFGYGINMYGFSHAVTGCSFNYNAVYDILASTGGASSTKAINITGNNFSYNAGGVYYTTAPIENIHGPGLTNSIVANNVYNKSLTITGAGNTIINNLLVT